jgi:hypothetical protein
MSGSVNNNFNFFGSGLSGLGIEDKWVALAYLLCILSTILCVVYGIINWNKGDEDVKSEDIKWVSEEKKVEDEL